MFHGMLHSAKDKVSGHSQSASTASTSSPASPPQANNSQPASNEKAPEGNPNDTEELDDEPKNMLLALASQLRIGMDLQKVTLPVFVLEPRSMLERITDFLSHSDLVFGAGANQDAEARFVQVMECYLAGWHIKPKGVKKPYNPILGEVFRCRYDYPDGTVGYYVAEQVSHHPPISAFYYASPDNKVIIRGDLRPKSKFLGNSAATIMEGFNKIAFMDRPEDGEYSITMPNMYARGILFGKMLLELGDDCIIKNDHLDYSCKVEFKTKGYFSGQYNAIHGKIKHGSKDAGEVNGKWSDRFTIKRGKHGENGEVTFDSATSKVTQKSVAAESEQGEFESRRLWSKVTAAILAKDLDAATTAKSAIEDHQRELAHQREQKGETFVPKYFKLVGDEFQPNFVLPVDASKANEAVAEWIYGTSSRPSKKDSI